MRRGCLADEGREEECRARRKDSGEEAEENRKGRKKGEERERGKWEEGEEREGIRFVVFINKCAALEQGTSSLLRLHYSSHMVWSLQDGDWQQARSNEKLQCQLPPASPTGPVCGEEVHKRNVDKTGGGIFFSSYDFESKKGNQET
ncbi:unnamed protein product [Pleuronectes platessa]|uniref:Uncharacterized protein n=1 Tax=Pleuronectes platessa TaxID=8262 RepID=A0A9N7U704_PLEPL|nr:unnamed protein product [Pleuronectes platessa]